MFAKNNKHELSETSTSGPSEASEVVPSETTPESSPSETSTSEPSEASEVVPSEITPESGPSETSTLEPSEASDAVPSETTPESGPSETSTTPASSASPSATLGESVSSQSSTLSSSEVAKLDATPSENLSESAPSEVPAPVLNEEFSQVAIESKSGHELLSFDEITETSSSEVSSELSINGKFIGVGQEDTMVKADIDFQKPNSVLLKPVLNQISDEGILTGIYSEKGLKKIANGQPSFSASDRKEVANAKRQLPQLNEEGTSRKLVEVMVVILMLLIFGQKKSRE